MLRFFDRPDTHWRSLQGGLHLYAMPAETAPIRPDFATMASALEGIAGLGVQPLEHMHVTIQRFDTFADELSDPRWARVLALLPEVLGRHAPIPMTFAAPQPNSHAVEAVGEATVAWTTLLDDLRETIVDCGLGSALTPAPFAPHYTLAYCLSSTPDLPVQEALAPVAATTAFVIDHIELVAVDQDPDEGVFRFQSLQGWHLGS